MQPPLDHWPEPPAYQLSLTTKPGAELFRIAQAEQAYLGLLLQHLPKDSQRSVHPARQCIKRLRALTRLCPWQQSKSGRTQDRDYQRLGRLLSTQRDAHVLSSTLLRLGKTKKSSNNHKEKAAGNPSRTLQLSGQTEQRLIDQVLENEARGSQADPSQLSQTGLDILSRCQRRLPALFADSEQWAIKDLYTLYINNYHLARQQYLRVKRHPSNTRLHRWRRLVQRQLNQVALIEPLLPGDLPGRKEPLQKLAKSLGNHNDLAVLRSHLKIHKGQYSTSKPRDRMASKARKEQRQCRNRALQLGRELFRQKRSQLAVLLVVGSDNKLKNGVFDDAKPVEIERKFLVDPYLWPELKKRLQTGRRIQQGYLNSADSAATIRVRIIDDQAFLTIKSNSAELVRTELEYPIPEVDARLMLDTLCSQPLIRKRRYHVDVGGLDWSIDVFKGANKGLIIAEIELSTPDQRPALPDWVAREVTGNARYYNSALIRSPYRQW